MIFENLGISDIASQGIDRAMAAYVHHLKNGGTTLCCRGQEARTQRVARELICIEPEQASVRLDDQRDRLIREALRQN